MTNDEMSINERRKYLKRMEKRYQEAKRSEKGRLLDEMEQVTGLHRKSLTRLLNKGLERRPRQRERAKEYGAELAWAASVVAESLDYICAERLKPTLLTTAEQLEKHGELRLTPELREQLKRVSVSTLRRLLKSQPRALPRLPRQGPERANQIAREIPIGRIAWNEAEPGHFEVDLVHHAGMSASGQYVHSLQMVDVATGWSERVAVLGRSYLVMEDGFRRILARLPFRLRELHPDNGSEFLNNHLWRFFREEVRDLRFSRSRPWQKNDNRFVEQKNDSLVRAYLGYDRLDSVAQTNLLNQLYDQMWLYYNFFQPVLRLKEKCVQPRPDGRRHITRRFDEARTPFDRLCATRALDPYTCARLSALRDQTNPRALRLHLYALLDQLFTLPGADPTASEDVYLTLFDPSKHPKGAALPVTLSSD